MFTSEYEIASTLCASNSEADLVLAVAAQYRGTEGKFVDQFEAELAQLLCTSAAVVASSDCGSISVLIGTLDLVPGDEVILPATSSPWLVFPWLCAGINIAFTDVAPGEFNPSPMQIEAKITARTRIIVISPPWGLPCDLEPIAAVAKRSGIPLAIDLSQSLGAPQSNSLQFLTADIGIISLRSDQPTISTGEGGVLFFREKELAQRAKSYARFSDLDGINLGINQKLSEVQAALGSIRLKRLPQLLRDCSQRVIALEDWLNRRGIITYRVPNSDYRNSVFVLAQAGNDFNALGLKAHFLPLAIDMRIISSEGYYPNARKMHQIWRAIACHQTDGVR